ncbi:hypothetical protein [Parasitella parasitica]|uniref:Uncharacterized protein n=1 Tax=Parasitella parasitica TaxID=35722 RepID=A0A0B7NIB8_9FUNG|nr:hypothetical protein [Parasitella parasitica]
MSHIPKKALICYCPYARPDINVPNIDQITERGCSGQIALEMEPFVDSDQAVAQLLGLFGAIDIKSEFKQRFNDMSLAIVSNDIDTLRIANLLGCHHEYISTQLKIDQLPFDVIFVDFSGFDDQDAWNTMNTIMGQNSRLGAIQCVVSSSIADGAENTQHWWDSIRPRQSHLTKNGRPLETVQEKTFIYSYLHLGSSRQDGASTFTESDIRANGCNGTILAWHLLAEVGHKLGHVPKYGA